MSPELKGFSLPLSPKGKAQLMGEYPWYFSAALMAFTYKADPAEIKKLLREPIEPSAVDPAECICWFGDWLVVTEDDKDIIVRNPERAQYKECTIIARGRFKDTEMTFSPYLWVDKDFALLAGWCLGVPKKLGNIYVGHNKWNLYELNKGIGKVGPGTRFGCFLEAHGERLITGTMKLSREISLDEFPPIFSTVKYTTVHFPAPRAGSKPKLNQLVSFDEKDVWFGKTWAADDATLVFTESELEEHTAIKPLEITGAYYVEMGTWVVGTTVLHEW